MQITRISPLEAADRMREGWIYLDIRPEEEFDEGHPAGAVNVPFHPDPARFVDAVKAAVGGAGARLVVGCRSGVVSVRAAELLASAGFSEVVEQRAGFEGSRGAFGELREAGWEREGLAVEREEES
ncbi:MAG TPA: rhodanese-like domain-containing protein [Polyangiaceae bacterium]|nr:rhodanese-like domain-containing protein [Polyangiaceae bacterium]